MWTACPKDTLQSLSPGASIHPLSRVRTPFLFCVHHLPWFTSLVWWLKSLNSPRKESRRSEHSESSHIWKVSILGPHALWKPWLVWQKALVVSSPIVLTCWAGHMAASLVSKNGQWLHDVTHGSYWNRPREAGHMNHCFASLSTFVADACCLEHEHDSLVPWSQGRAKESNTIGKA